MERRKFGRTELIVPVIGMGTWQTFDVRGAREESVREQIVAEALAAGADLFDSSPMYGEAERVLGKALSQRRGDALIATKVWAQSVNQGKRQIERSFSYFGGHVEVYQVHNLVNWQAYLPLLSELKAQGKVGSVGVTHYSHSAFPELLRVMEREEVDAVQIPYNAADRLVERDILPRAKELDLGVIIMRPLEVGELTRHPPPREKWKHLEKFGLTTWAQVLLKWIVSDPRVHVAIPATSKSERMTENAAAGNPPFFDEDTREEVARLASR